MGAFDIQVASVTTIAADTITVFSYGTNQPPKAFAAASIVADITTVTGTWTINVLYNTLGTNLPIVYQTTGITTVTTGTLTPQAPYSTAGAAIPSNLSVQFDNTSAGTLSATVRLIAVT